MILRALTVALALGAAGARTATSPSLPAPPEGVAWFEGDFERAVQTATASDRLLLLNFWTEW